MESMSTEYIIKVSGTSRAAAVAGAIAGIVRDRGYAEVRAIGAGAVNQALKGLVLAVQYLQGDGISVAFVPELIDVDIEGSIRTAIHLTIRRKDDFHKEVYAGTRSEDT